MTEEKHKRCFKCGETKPLSDFYKHPRMADGHVNKCKECNKKDVRENRSDSLDYYREYDRIRGQDLQADRYKKKLEYGREYRRNNQHKKKAQTAVSCAIKSGTLVKQTHCEYCGKSGRLHAHHSSYSEDMYLVVTWLCGACHAILHKTFERTICKSSNAPVL